MAGPSNIEWTEQTWNPTVGCSIVSPGCTHCYAMGMAARIEAMTAALVAEGKTGAPHYDGTTKKVKGVPVWTGKINLAPEHILLEPLRRKKPTTYFVNSMSDLFHESIPDEQIDRVFAVMALSPQHTLQVLTKRAERMREYLTRHQVQVRWLKDAKSFDEAGLLPKGAKFTIVEPLPNVWLGVSAERQQEADERIPLLRETPAAVRFISFEPLLAHIDPDLHGIHWAIVGGESGPNARPMHPVWARRIRNVCAERRVPFFFKQRGEYTWVDDDDYDADCIPELPANWRERTDGKFRCMRADGSAASGYAVDSAEFFYRVGKKAAGRLLDGKEHNGFPLRNTPPLGNYNDDSRGNVGGVVQS